MGVGRMCPIMSKDVMMLCKKEKCEWWYDNRCAIYMIADAIHGFVGLEVS